VRATGAPISAWRAQNPAPPPYRFAVILVMPPREALYAACNVRFEAMIAAGEFLEWADVFGNLYGTSAADTERLLAQGCDVVLVIDVQGARKVRGLGIAITTVFVMPPSAGVLEQRLRGRSKDSEEAIQCRLAVAREEVAAFADYDYVVINDELTAAVDRLRSIVVGERARLGCMRAEAEHIVRTFS
jgi:guanylate kinase